MIRCYACGGTYARTIMRAFAEGCGGTFLEQANPEYQAAITVVWGLLRGAPDIIARAKADGAPWYYLDHGYVKRGHPHGYFRATFQSYQKTWVEERPADRWEALETPLRPWRGGTDVVYVPPSPTVSALFGPIVMPMGDPVSPKNGKPVLEKFPKAKAIVTWNSIAAVEAVIAGVPAVVYGESAARPVASPSTDDLRFPEREPWAHSLAYGQWTLKEMESGQAWQVLSKYLSDGTPEKSSPGTFWPTQ
jgi:transposase